MTELQLALAEVARKDGDNWLLRDTSETLIRDSPFDPRGYILRAESESQNKQMDAAARDLKKALEISPENASLCRDGQSVAPRRQQSRRA
jgi:Tfp pilus assembly protein PilF